MAFCQQNKIHLISDEVYALSTYAADEKLGHGFVSVLSIDSHDLIDESRLHVLYGMSKVGVDLRQTFHKHTSNNIWCRTLQLLAFGWDALSPVIPCCAKQ